MTIQEKLDYLKMEIINNFPTVQKTDSQETVALIRYIQAYLAEILLQINRVLASISFLEDSPSDDSEKKRKLIFINLAEFCMAMSLVGKSRLKAAMINHPIDGVLCKSLDLILKQIYDANSYLDPSKELSDSDYEKGLLACHQFSDPAEDAKYAFKPYLPGVENSKFLAICSISPAHQARTNEVRKALDPTYQSEYADLSSSRTPLYPSAASSSSSSSTSQLYNTNFSPVTEGLFAGVFTDKKTPKATDKKELLEQSLNSTKSISTNSSSSNYPRSVTLTRGMFRFLPHILPHKKLRIVGNPDPQAMYNSSQLEKFSPR